MDDRLGAEAARSIPEVCRALNTWALDWRFIEYQAQVAQLRQGVEVAQHRVQIVSLITSSPHGRTSWPISEEL